LNLDKPLFSVLIANYNNGQYIPECIDSVLVQTYSNWEIVFVDDGSTDSSLSVIQQYAERDQRIRIFQNEQNEGCGYTKRRCASLAKGEICGFVDPDDALVQDAVELSVKEHLEYSDVSLVYSQCYEADERMNIKGLWNSGGEIPHGKSQLNEPISRIGHFATFKKHLYDQTEGIDPQFERAVDQDLYLKMEEAGTLRYIDRPLYLYRIHDKGLSSMNKSRLKAYYWYLVAQRDAYNRRRLNVNEVENIASRDLKKRFLDYYLTEAYQAMEVKQWSRMYKQLYHALRYIMVDRRLSVIRLALQPIKHFLP